ncbi:hypothetical protein EDC65_2657 [Stella humosa]|uniref:Uncharacterized protein n=1 Tax=Stella humosa TaxID=94 RepID=A0A3N1LIY3_9PROT|nr:hypothetical protein [Stella humosa]ROP90798.1 hypothetical protein EDC65_2657 [Stella humosa]BBK34856.1 hypothetical protein STHU_54900 [Stella humosa]
MFGIFGDSLERLFIKELKGRGASIPKGAMREIVAMASGSIDAAHRALPGDYGRNLGEDVILHYAGWTARIVNRAAGRPARISAIDPDVYPETEAAIRAILVKHGALKA